MRKVSILALICLIPLLSANNLGALIAQGRISNIYGLSDSVMIIFDPYKIRVDFALAKENQSKPEINAVPQLAMIQKNSIIALKKPVEVKYGYPLFRIVTAYSSTPDQTDNSPFTTAMGTQVRDGIVAANFLKFGTKVQFPELYGDKVFVVEDRMAKRNSHKVDIWFPTRTEAKRFGVKRARIVVLEDI